MPECISIDLILTCSVCGCSLKGEVDVRNAEIIVEPCQNCMQVAREEASRNMLRLAQLKGV